MIIWGVPTGIRQLIFLKHEVSALIVRKKAHHHLVREWPGLGGLVADIPHIQPGLFFHFSDNGLFEALTGFNKASDQAIKVSGNT